MAKFFIEVEGQERTSGGTEVTLLATGFGDGLDPKSPLARRAKKRGAIATGFIPDRLGGNLKKILEYGYQVQIVDVREVPPERTTTIKAREEFGPVANAASTYKYVVRVSSV